MYLDLNKVWLDSKRKTEYVAHNTKAIQNIINTNLYQQMHYDPLKSPLNYTQIL